MALQQTNGKKEKEGREGSKEGRKEEAPGRSRVVDEGNTGWPRRISCSQR